jgi:RNA polymerase sigma-70 factor, ECF subfamily
MPSQNHETEALWREFHQRLRAFVARRVPRASDVEDVLQEVFIRIHKAADSLQLREQPAAWVFQITRNVMVDHFRATNRQPVAIAEDIIEEHLESPAPAGSVADVPSELAELAGCLAPMIAGLPPIYREAIQLTDLHGVTQAEAARRVRVSVSGMKSRVQRARAELRAKLLECCRVELDRRGGIVEYSVRDTGSCCGSSEPQPSSSQLVQISRYAGRS